MLPDGFRFATYRFECVAGTPVQLPQFAGAKIRGSFGWALKRLCCVVDHGECGRCLLRYQCAYSYLFETSPPPGAKKLAKLSDIPRPFVFRPDADISAGETFSFELVLIGHAIDYLPYFLYAFVRIGEHGLYGRAREGAASPGRFTVRRVLGIDADGAPLAEPVYDSTNETLSSVGLVLDGAAIERAAAALPTDELTIRFVTPTRIKGDGMIQTAPEFRHLLRAVAARISTLAYFHCGTEVEADFRALIDAARAVETVAEKLNCTPLSRYSRRQDRRIPMDGFTGTVTWRGDLAPFLPYIAAGELIHVGKGTVMGMGKYALSQSCRGERPST